MSETAVFCHDTYLKHDPGPGHPESPERLAVIYEQLDRPENQEGLVFPDVTPASHDILELIHTSSHVQRVADTEGQNYSVLDPDTTASPFSYEAACLAAGAAVDGVKMVMNGEAANGLALVRPPGHHAEADHTSGFCLFNNVAIGAQFALNELGAERVLLIDWDLHHGNGTQHSFYDTDQVLYFSTHQYPYFPGTGGIHEVGRGVGEGYTINVPLPGGQDDRAYACIFRELLYPIAKQYKPDLILVSAGFDIYHGDPLGTMGVTATGFAFLTRQLLTMAEEICQGRLFLLLEGGYNLSGLRDGVLAVLAELAGRSVLQPDEITTLEEASPSLMPMEQTRSIAKKYWKL